MGVVWANFIDSPSLATSNQWRAWDVKWGLAGLRWRMAMRGRTSSVSAL